MASIMRSCILCVMLMAMLASSCDELETASHNFSGPFALAVDETNQKLYIAEKTAQKIEVLLLQSSRVENTFTLSAEPTGMALSPDGSKLYVTTGKSDGTLLTISAGTGLVEDTISVGHSPLSPVVDSTGTDLYLANRFAGTVAKVDFQTGLTQTLTVSREPVAIALTPDDETLVVAHHLPQGPANVEHIAAVVSLVDTNSFTLSGEIGLPDGSTGARGITLSPDGLYAYVTHILAHYEMPTNQLDRGWIITNAVSIIDIKAGTRKNTILLDDVYKGAANPWAIGCSADGKYLLATHSGTHEVSVISLDELHIRLDAAGGGGEFSTTPEEIPYDLGFLSGIRKRIPLNGNGPRALAIVGSDAYIAEYFSDSIGIVRNFASDSPSIDSIAPDPDSYDPSRLQQGETLFNDARNTYQQWLSCATCHPDARADALNWDLGNDGLGSPRNAKSLVLAHDTPPAMITGIRADAQTAVRAGLKFIEFSVRPEEEAVLLDEYLQSVVPVPSPYLNNGSLGTAAENGRLLFEQAECGSCHSGAHYTDMLSYDVGTGRDPGEALDTPALNEVWRTAPYLQDGRAETIIEVLTTSNPDDLHGVTSGLTQEEIKALAEYVLSL